MSRFTFQPTECVMQKLLIPLLIGFLAGALTGSCGLIRAEEFVRADAAPAAEPTAKAPLPVLLDLTPENGAFEYEGDLAGSVMYGNCPAGSQIMIVLYEYRFAAWTEVDRQTINVSGTATSSFAFTGVIMAGKDYKIWATIKNTRADLINYFSGVSLADRLSAYTCP